MALLCFILYVGLVYLTYDNFKGHEGSKNNIFIFCGAVILAFIPVVNIILAFVVAYRELTKKPIGL